MSYAAITFIAGEQPTTAKWNILGSNDAAFNNGTGIANLEIGSGSVTSLKNDYKFRVHLVAATNTSNGSARVPFDTKDYDTSTNVDVATNKGRFTAPVAGFYWFSGTISVSGGSYITCDLYKNGSLNSVGSQYGYSGITGIATVGDQIQLAANDYVELFYNDNGAHGFNVGSPASNYFSGFLVSNT